MSKHANVVLTATASLVVAGAMLGAATVAGSFGSAQAPQTVTVQNAGQTSDAPTVTVKKVAPVVKHTSKKSTTTKARTLVSAQQAPVNAAADEPAPTLTPPPPVIGNGPISGPGPVPPDQP